MRLNKYISHNSKYSRREADSLIFEGKVRVNNKPIKNPAIDVEEGDQITVNGKFIKRADEFSVIIYNKKKGELVTKNDPRGRKTIFHVLPTRFRHFMPIGRLDYASEGLIILSDSHEVVETLMTSDLPRVYRVKIKGSITDSITNAMKEGITINNTKGAHELTNIMTLTLKPFINYEIIKNKEDYSILKVAISEGKNRELRRFFANFDRDVVDLKRDSYGWISLNNLKEGKWRFLDKQEYHLLHDYLKTLKRQKKRLEQKDISDAKTDI